MDGGIYRCFAILLAVLAFGTAPAMALTGQVIDPDGKPVKDARACYMVENRAVLCDWTDESGSYTLPDSHISTVRITAKGYLPKWVSAAEQDAPIPIDRSATLRVRLLDAMSDEGIPKGKVRLQYTTGLRRGPVPCNAAGVIIRTLQPGEVLVIGEADGFRKSEGRLIVLEAGKEEYVVIELQPDDERTPPASPGTTESEAP